MTACDTRCSVNRQGDVNHNANHVQGNTAPANYGCHDVLHGIQYMTNLGESEMMESDKAGKSMNNVS